MKKSQLFLIHFAGGNSYSFEFLLPLLKCFNIFTLELPGRGKRIRENLLRDFDLAADDFYNQVLKRLTGDEFMLYGHSMGASLAFRVCQMLENDNLFPKCVFVSGNPGPGIKIDKVRHLLQDDDLIYELKKLGGIPDELFENKELLDLVLPILRADFELSEKNSLESGPKIRTPIYAMMGNMEEKYTEISNWGRFTKSQFKSEIFEGGHFFIHQHPQKIAKIINDIQEIKKIT